MALLTRVRSVPVRFFRFPSSQSPSRVVSVPPQGFLVPPPTSLAEVLREQTLHKSATTLRSTVVDTASAVDRTTCPRPKSACSVIPPPHSSTPPKPVAAADAFERRTLQEPPTCQEPVHLTPWLDTRPFTVPLGSCPEPVLLSEVCPNCPPASNPATLIIVRPSIPPS